MGYGRAPKFPAYDLQVAGACWGRLATGAWRLVPASCQLKDAIRQAQDIPSAASIPNHRMVGSKLAAPTVCHAKL
jgi:hypothetical protein